MATAVGPSDDGGIRIDLAIRNDTADWSTMAAAMEPAVLRGGDGRPSSAQRSTSARAGIVWLPGFQMRGLHRRDEGEPELVQLGVECDVGEVPAGLDARPSTTRTWSVSSTTTTRDASRADGTIDFALDTSRATSRYPVGQPVDGLVQPADVRDHRDQRRAAELTGMDPVGRTA